MEHEETEAVWMGRTLIRFRRSLGQPGGDSGGAGGEEVRARESGKPEPEAGVRVQGAGPELSNTSETRKNGSDSKAIEGTQSTLPGDCWDDKKEGGQEWLQL